MRVVHGLIAIVIGALFLVHFVPLYKTMPQHVDTWITIVMANEMLKQDAITPYVYEEPVAYPRAGAVILAVVARIAHMHLFTLAQVLPGLFLAALGLLNYAIAKQLFASRAAAISAMALTVLVLSNMTMLGPYFLVPAAFGLVLIMTVLYLLVINKMHLTMLVAFTAGFFHSTSAVFILVLIALYCLFYQRTKRTVAYAVASAALVALALFATRSTDTVITAVKYATTLHLLKPYFIPQEMASPLFFWLFGLGFFLIMFREHKARKILIPIIAFLVFDMLLFWKRGDGILIEYRRLVSLIFLFFPLVIGYGVARGVQELSTILKNKKLHIQYGALFVVLIFLFVKGVQLNIAAHESEIYVTPVKGKLFTQLSQKHFNAYVLAHHLESYALPYFNLRPIMLSPQHGIPMKWYDEVHSAYLNVHEDELVKFFENHPEFEFMFYPFDYPSRFFDKELTVDGLSIYRYKRGEQ